MMAGVRQSLSNVYSTLCALLALTLPNVLLVGATCRGLTALPLGADQERVTDFVT